jgi:hypothetical protein
MLRTFAAAAAVTTFALATPAQAQQVDRPPMKSCGDFVAPNGLHIDDVTARRVTCRRARRVARLTPEKCGLSDSTCRVLRFRCIVAQAFPELRFARCSKFGEGDPLFKTVRFEFGS